VGEGIVQYVEDEFLVKELCVADEFFGGWRRKREEGKKLMAL
jgi:hypothetical protein